MCEIRFSPEKYHQLKELAEEERIFFYEKQKLEARRKQEIVMWKPNIFHVLYAQQPLNASLTADKFATHIPEINIIHNTLLTFHIIFLH